MAVTIRSLREAHRGLFHPTQDWFLEEAFIDVPIRDARPTPVNGFRVLGCVEPFPEGLVPAITLVAAYVADPGNPIWRDYLWTADMDHEGQRIYVGGLANGRGFEIHRHLRLSHRWRVPTWGA